MGPQITVDEKFLMRPVCTGGRHITRPRPGQGQLPMRIIVAQGKYMSNAKPQFPFQVRNLGHFIEKSNPLCG